MTTWLAYLALLLAVPRCLPLWESAAWFEKLYILTAVSTQLSCSGACNTCGGAYMIHGSYGI